MASNIAKSTLFLALTSVVPVAAATTPTALQGFLENRSAIGVVWVCRKR